MVTEVATHFLKSMTLVLRSATREFLMRKGGFSPPQRNGSSKPPSLLQTVDLIWFIRMCAEWVEPDAGDGLSIL
jgi:hypothetical protein